MGFVFSNCVARLKLKVCFIRALATSSARTYLESFGNCLTAFRGTLTGPPFARSLVLLFGTIASQKQAGRGTDDRSPQIVMWSSPFVRGVCKGCAQLGARFCVCTCKPTGVLHPDTAQRIVPTWHGFVERSSCVPVQRRCKWPTGRGVHV